MKRHQKSLSASFLINGKGVWGASLTTHYKSQKAIKDVLELFLVQKLLFWFLQPHCKVFILTFTLWDLGTWYLRFTYARWHSFHAVMVKRAWMKRRADNSLLAKQTMLILLLKKIYAAHSVFVRAAPHQSSWQVPRLSCLLSLPITPDFLFLIRNVRF